MKKSPAKSLFLSFAIVLLGTASGYSLSRVYGSKAPSSQTPDQTATESTTGLKVGDIIGIKDSENFRDPAEGVLVKGGIDGEGSHHLMREGGPGRSVYLTSSVVDLDSLVNHRVKVWGETFAAQKAGWLMDVGKVEILELNAPKPFEEEPLPVNGQAE